MQAKSGFLRILFGRTLLVVLSLLLNLTVSFLLLFRLLQNVPLLFGGTVAFTAVVLLYILNTREDPSVKLSWCVLIALLPLFGAILYFFTRFDLGHRVEQRRLRRTLRESSAHLPVTGVDPAQVKNEDRALHNLASYLRSSGSGQLFSNTQVTYFPLGETMFRQLCRELEKAEKYIFLEYFTIGQSHMWDTLLKILARKARQGIEVRVMYDGSCALGYLPHDYPKQLEKLGIRCKVFSPFRIFVSTHYNNRDHRKIAVIDGKVAFTGGINILDRYIGRKQVYGHWKDTAVMLRGDGARGFAMMFLQLWNVYEKAPEYDTWLDIPSQPSAPGYVIPYCDSPLDSERVGEAVYLDILNRAKEYVYIMTPYLILDGQMLGALCFAAKRGVDVRLVLPHIPDKRYAFVLAKSHYRELLEAGVKIFEYTPGFVHAKTFLCDDREAVVGTINLDYRSLYLHFECAAYLYQTPALADIRRDFEDTFQKSHRVTMDDVRRQGPLTRLAGALLKLAAPLM